MRQVDTDSAPARRDPAPSRWAYRLHRLWLTPAVRKFLRLGLPLAVSGLALTWVFAQPQNRSAFTEMYSDIRRSIAERPEFMVQVMAIDGASEELSADIREILPVDFPISSFDLDLEAMQEVVEQLDAVARVDLRIRPGGLLQIDVTERIPAVVWRVQGMLELLDEAGRRVAALYARTDRADLPLIAGLGADREVPEALELIAAAGPIADRMRGVLRVGERRWDVVLDRDQRIMLPETRPVDALEQVIALHQAQELLARDLAAVDMRNPARPTLRMRPHAVEELHRIKGIELGDILQ
ncbi:cell division protein FtsQ/DivIB [Psychromarinibacter sp. C21-152]|uniref:Cell division protein FtsQ n=1 Tax=Psychromarinibacter sediminicola TaxID=3033385 RepID=A0AAE3T6Y3_9RHOB|nr:cell division protein FtsQ/DivIB [Psychromarinibacter sediminicola]MDF0599752.1 cell division protein FtsQ/DivIB [Psychromarinibacter sediminicola]